MTQIVLRPDGSVLLSLGAGTDGKVVGAASAEAALADSNDSSYYTHEYANTGVARRFTFPTPTVPAGALVKRLGGRIRTSSSSPSRCGLSLYRHTYSELEQNPALGAATDVNVTWGTPTTTSLTALEAPQLPLDSIEILLSLVYGPPPDVSRVHELYADVTYVAKPTVALTGPSGAIETTNQPTVAWTATLDPDGGAQTAFQVRVFTAAQYGAGGFSPNSSPATYTLDGAGAASTTQAGVLTDGTYRAYVRVAQTVNGTTLWSDWATSDFTVDVARPPAPTITTNAQGAQGRVQINVTGQDDTTTTDALELQRSTDAGITWTPVRLLTAQPHPAATLTAYDYEGANGATVLYRARALHSYTGSYAASAWTTTSGAWSDTSWWLKVPNRPALNRRVAVRQQPSATRAARQGIFQPLGAGRPIVVSDQRLSARGTLVLRLKSDGGRNALDALLDADVVLVQAPVGQHWDDRYVAFGDHTRERVSPVATSSLTFDTVPWVEVDAPPGNVAAWPAPAGSLGLPLSLPLVLTG